MIRHRIALTPDETATLEDEGAHLCPELWRETRRTLELADRADGPTHIELGFEPLVHAWLGVADERALVKRFGMTIAEGLALDAGQLARLAASLEQGAGPQSLPLDPSLSHAWTARAERLMDALPQSAEVVLQTLERALDGLPWDPPVIRAGAHAILHVAHLVGDEVRMRAARRLLAMLDESDASSSPDVLPLVIASQILTVLYGAMHEGLLLEEERVLEPDLAASHWPFVAGALRDGRLDDVPAPIHLLPVWGAPDDLTADIVRGCLRACAEALPHLLDELERLWGGRAVSDPPDAVARAMAAVAVIRHTRIQRAYLPPPCERGSIWFEVHQGARRPASLERADLLRRLRAVLLRCEVDPLAVAAAHLDGAKEHQALGDHDETRAALADAMRWTARYQGEQSRRDHGAVCFAQQRWLAGEPEDALRRLRDLDGEKASELLCDIEARAGAREVLREAEDEDSRERTIESWCEVAISHLLAGHGVRAELTSREICEHHPESGLAWHTLASVLEDLGRYRDALQPARKALSLATDPAYDRVRLDGLLRRLSPDVREQSLQLTADGLPSSADTDDPACA